MSHEGEDTLQPTPRTRVRRLPARGVYDRAAIEAILDEALVCHVAFAVDGQPFVLPTTYGRADDRLFLHGAAVGRLFRTLREGVPVCVTVTLLDGLVLARSAFHHSMNYRSVVILGVATEVTDEREKREALRAIVDHVVPGRWPEVRGPSPEELRATTVLSLPIAEASAKVRTGPPLDAPADLTMPVWAGEVPLRLSVLEPVPDPHLAPGTAAPASFEIFRRNGSTGV